MVWKKLGKEGLAVKAPWPVAEEEDKILTRQSKFLQDSLKSFRSQAGKAKKGWETASIVVCDSYPKWKVDVLAWMQEQYSQESGFPETFMKDLKTWSSTNIEDKKLLKFAMQFASFVKKEVEEVGAAAMDVQLPFDQKDILVECKKYIMTQLNMSSLDIVNLDTDTDADVPDNKAELATPGKPYLWLR